MTKSADALQKNPADSHETQLKLFHACLDFQTWEQ